MLPAWALLLVIGAPVDAPMIPVRLPGEARADSLLWRATPQHADPRVADLEAQLADLRRQLADRDAAPKPPDIGRPYSCRYPDGRLATGWVILRPEGSVFVEAPK